MSDSVTGSAAEALLNDPPAGMDDNGSYYWKTGTLAERIVAIQREAEDKLIDRIVRLNYGKDPDLAKRMDEARQRMTE